MIIGINGYIGSGKDTVGSIIQYVTEYPKSGNMTDNRNNRSYNSFLIDVGVGWEPQWQIKKFAEKLKQIASLLTGIPREKFEDQKFKKTNLSQEWNRVVGTSYPEAEDIVKEMTVREFLQKLGTEAIRNGLHTNAWVNALFSDYHPYSVRGSSYEEVESKWIITDVRFPNEAKGIKDRGGVIIRVNRDWSSEMTVKEGMHPSETSLDDWEFDYVIDNTGTIDELVEKVKVILKELKII